MGQKLVENETFFVIFKQRWTWKMKLIMDFMRTKAIKFMKELKNFGQEISYLFLQLENAFLAFHISFDTLFSLRNCVAKKLERFIRNVKKRLVENCHFAIWLIWVIFGAKIQNYKSQKKSWEFLYILANFL